MKIKKNIIVLLILLVIILIGVIIMLWLSSTTTKIPTNQAIIKYKYMEVDFVVDLTSEESKIIKSILNHKIQYDDNPSCGFNSNIVIEFDEISFSIACDGCGILRVNNTGKYISIAKKNREKIEEIFEKYGGRFPCV